MDPYDLVPYGGRPLAEAHPERLFVIARLFGLQPVPPGGARVLEVGCGAGAHLAPIAARLPASRCVGLDRSEHAIQWARRRSAGRGNVQWIQGDLCDHLTLLDQPELPGAYDYIVAHGVLSWVPEAVADALLELIQRWLAPSGVAYLSYNTLPGWGVRGSIRRMLRFHTEAIEDPAAQIGQGRALLSFLSEVVPASDPYGGWLRREAALVDEQPDSWVFHDLMAERNTPFLLSEVVERAQQRGLAYLGDADLPSMLPDRMPERVRETLDQLGGDLVRLEQYLDFVVCRNFRRSLLVPDPARLDRALSWERLVELHVRGLIVPVSREEDGTETFETFAGDPLSTSLPLLCAALRILIEAGPATVAFEALVVQARARTQQPPQPDDRAVLGRNLLICFTRGVVMLHAVAVAVVPQPTDRPTADPWIRAEAAGAEIVTSLLHDVVRIDGLDRSLLPLLDGTRERAELVEVVALVLQQGRATLRRDGQEVDDPDELRAWLRSEVSRRLEGYGAAGLLIAEP